MILGDSVRYKINENVLHPIRLKIMGISSNYIDSPLWEKLIVSIRDSVNFKLNIEIRGIR